MNTTTAEDTSISTSPLLVVLSGPSGVGKDAALIALRALGRPWHFVVTATTRTIRPGEQDGVDYHFLQPAQFQTLMDKGELLEHAQVYGNWYGVPKQQIRDALHRGQDVIAKIDVQGAATIKKLAPESVLIFLAPSNMEELRSRLEARATETGADFERRVGTAWHEMEHLPDFDYRVINKEGRLDEAVMGIDAIITAERSRVVPRCVNV